MRLAGATAALLLQLAVAAAVSPKLGLDASEIYASRANDTALSVYAPSVVFGGTQLASLPAARLEDCSQACRVAPTCSWFNYKSCANVRQCSW